jgi:hypothetical protein
MIHVWPEADIALPHALAIPQLGCIVVRRKLGMLEHLQQRVERENSLMLDT